MRKILLTGAAVLLTSPAAAQIRLYDAPQCHLANPNPVIAQFCANLQRQKTQHEHELAQLQAMQKKAEEDRIAREAEARKPSNQLKEAYLSYQYVQACFEGRQGYVVTWINDIELERARNAIKSIEQRFLKLDPQLNTTALYQAATNPDVLRYAATSRDGNGCRAHYQSLLAKAPAPVPIKDFGKDSVESN